MSTTKLLGFLREIITTLVIALVISFIVRHSVVEARVVPSGSMLPTIQLQDRIIIDKLFFHFTELERQDIIVFKPPSRAKINDEDYIKRVIGLPGDKVEVQQGKVYINDQPLNEPYLMNSPDYQYGPVVVPAYSYFVLGDNRNNSLDSHYWGMLPKENILGKTLFRYWPLEQFGKLQK